MAAADEMIGCCHSRRRFERLPGLQKGLTRWRFQCFWGSEVEKMPLLFKQRMAAGATVEVNTLFMKRKIVLKMEDISQTGFACVSYPGNGKYNPEVDRCIRWENLCEEELLEPLSGAGPETLIDEKNGDQEAILSKLDKHMDGTQIKGPDGSVRGWWPVVVVSWHNMARDHGFHNAAEFHRLQAIGAIPLYVSCWYQLADGSWILIAWPVFAISRL
jgi:hypothetical protein